MSFAFSPEIGYSFSFEGDVVVHPRSQCIPGEHGEVWHTRHLSDLVVGVEAAEGEEVEEEEGVDLFGVDVLKFLRSGMIHVVLLIDLCVALLANTKHLVPHNMVSGQE